MYLMVYYFVGFVFIYFKGKRRGRREGGKGWRGVIIIIKRGGGDL